jgi:drug/metabolite transporter (DMT)-like permease
VLGAALAVLAAATNAVGSVLQRRASLHRTAGSTAWRGLVELLRRPGWSAGIAAHVVGFVLQGVALGLTQITVVQPLLIAELPFTLVLSALAFRAPLGRRASTAIAVTAAGLALFLFSLSPTSGHSLTTPLAVWLVGLGAGTALVIALIVLAVRSTTHRRALFFGVATGTTYGLNAALLTGVAVAYGHGWGAVFGAWQTYGVLIGGTVSFVLLQQALQAGDLLAAQPGITLANPLLALLWGFVVFGERIELGPWLVGVLVGGLGLVGGTIVLIRAAAPVVVGPTPVLEHLETAGERPAPSGSGPAPT